MFPDEIETYYEPFLGGGSILFQLMVSNKTVKNFKVSDINNDLIKLWKMIKEIPSTVADGYSYLWKELNKDSDLERKKKFYFFVRDRFNTEKSPVDFMFIMRTTVNGMPRYNRNGKFNNAFHVTRNGILPDSLKEIIFNWSYLLNRNNVVFESKSYESIFSKEGDLVYLDPPYAGVRGMYYGTIDYDAFWKWMRLQKGKYALSFDGKTTSLDMTYAVPIDIYKTHVYLYAGNSSFRRTIGKSNNEYVSESLYKNYE
jgi:DNA adenine methylase